MMAGALSGSNHRNFGQIGNRWATIFLFAFAGFFDYFIEFVQPEFSFHGDQSGAIGRAEQHDHFFDGTVAGFGHDPHLRLARADGHQIVEAAAFRLAHELFQISLAERAAIFKKQHPGLANLAHQLAFRFFVHEGRTNKGGPTGDTHGDGAVVVLVFPVQAKVLRLQHIDGQEQSDNYLDCFHSEDLVFVAFVFLILRLEFVELVRAFDVQHLGEFGDFIQVYFTRKTQQNELIGLAYQQQ